MALVTYSRLGINARRLYWDIISHPNIQALWPMNEASGDILDRCVRTRLTGVAQGSGGTYGASLGNGFVGISLAASRIFQLAAVGPLNFERTDAFSILCVLNPNITTAGEILSTFSTTGIIYEITALRIVLASLYGGAANELRRDSDVALTNGTTYMLGMTYDGLSAVAGMILYRNGAVDASTAISNTLTNSITSGDTLLKIGARPDNTNLLNATLGFLAVFNAVLTANEILRYARLGGFA